ncbi:MAG: hypothetical protein B6D72_04010 [gamma proteobacterium symbiont of Ctena orbiculata]|uniref:Uncharacterized protein n=1 Tax=Candidatus Thiodiazotropha taylori TaxID=2792791 RepID=A0A944MBT0_9GAMM|nr:hypothetical protein [Candidatus Thiodiazotropha taylori]PUB85721.1 MAG: hypothetical protein DBP00_12615 [gamma proteobacterium symbiont of Ctena orbiculata]MBT2988155.1 hypothetical protein [Candidatus Thiodiazotropha taylori]MBT2998519.1 hypothetical protein [Candidatus Thiodiazotropha taylori]MBT3002103.1 hypothetical protein [Candidatus Thiodiazotropha taylori]
MLKENVIPHLLITDDQKWQFKTGVGSARQRRNRVKGSIRELELMAASLRRGGENRAADELDGDIMAMLEKKICRKIVNRSRKEQKMLHMGSA